MHAQLKNRKKAHIILFFSSPIRSRCSLVVGYFVWKGFTTSVPISVRFTQTRGPNRKRGHGSFFFLPLESHHYTTLQTLVQLYPILLIFSYFSLFLFHFVVFLPNNEWKSLICYVCSRIPHVLKRPYHPEFLFTLYDIVCTYNKSEI